MSFCEVCGAPAATRLAAVRVWVTGRIDLPMPLCASAACHKAVIGSRVSAGRKGAVVLSKAEDGPTKSLGVVVRIRVSEP